MTPDYVIMSMVPGIGKQNTTYSPRASHGATLVEFRATLYWRSLYLTALPKGGSSAVKHQHHIAFSMFGIVSNSTYMKSNQLLVSCGRGKTEGAGKSQRPDQDPGVCVMKDGPHSISCSMARIGCLATLHFALSSFYFSGVLCAHLVCFG